MTILSSPSWHLEEKQRTQFLILTVVMIGGVLLVSCATPMELPRATATPALSKPDSTATAVPPTPTETATTAPPTATALAPVFPSATTHSIQPAVASNPTHLVISNVCDTSFTISWLTPTDETGQVQLIDGGIYDDDRGASFHGTTHYVTITGLSTNDKYAFDVISNGERHDNAGAHWMTRIGAMLLPRPSDLIFGQVRNPDGSTVTDAIVFSTIDRIQQRFPSAPLSVLVTAHDDGFFSIDLAQARTLLDPTSYFDYAISGDRYMNNSVTLFVVSARGTGLVTVDMGDARLRSSDPEQWLVIHLSVDVETP